MKRKNVVRLVQWVAFVVLLSIVVSGCARRTRHVYVHPAGATVVVVKKGHKHSVHCGHYKHGNRWYLLKGHVHKRGCGHRKVRGVWIVR